MIFTKESSEAWDRMQNWGWEINLCLQYQYPYKKNESDEKIVSRLEVYGEILDELISQWNEETKK